MNFMKPQFMLFLYLTNQIGVQSYTVWEKAISSELFLE